MGNAYKVLILVLVCVLSFGCSHRKKPEESYADYERFRQSYAGYADLGGDWDWTEENDPTVSGKVLRRAHSAIGTPYVWGGVKPGGFDCSGLVQWAYRGAGVRLPRTAAEQKEVGFAIRDLSQMRPGDIVAFRRSHGGYHTGIYIGDGKFIHAPRTNTRVRIESMESGFFKTHFIGARRVDMSKGSMALAQASEEADREYRRDRAAREREERAERRRERDRDRDEARSSRRDRNRDRDEARSSRRGRDRDEARSSRRDRDKDEARGSRRGRDRDRDEARSSRRDRDRDEARGSRRGRDRDRDEARSSRRDRDRDEARSSRKDRGRDRDRDEARSSRRDRDRDEARSSRGGRDRDEARGSGKDPSRDRSKDKDEVRSSSQKRGAGSPSGRQDQKKDKDVRKSDQKKPVASGGRAQNGKGAEQQGKRQRREITVVPAGKGSKKTGKK
ncbi:MAG: C40 family peptidase [Desulfovibrio sp.]|nr:C40 family peptidase [Desulfovibrio sp.]